jgi:hypothetical protein
MVAPVDKKVRRSMGREVMQGLLFYGAFPGANVVSAALFQEVDEIQYQHLAGILLPVEDAVAPKHR